MLSHSQLAGHRFLGITQSLCPTCFTVVSAKILSREGRIYFRKHCPQHGIREDFVCGDETWFDRLEYTVPGRIPPFRAIEPNLGCPFDCGLCQEHEQHTCVGVLEITDNCNLTCPMCYAESAPGRKHLSYEACCDAIDHLVRAEGKPEVLQLSGGEPTIHPDFERILAYACEQPIDVVMINTNGIRIAKDPALRDVIARHRRRCQVYLQFDGLTERVYKSLRGEELLQQKLRAVERLGEMQVFTTLVCTVDSDDGLCQVGDLIRFGAERAWVAGISFQPATYVGRYLPPENLEQRITFPEIIRATVDQSQGVWRRSDFLPIPCAHPNAHTVAYAYRHHGEITPLTRFMEIEKHLDLLANGISFSRDHARSLIQEFISRESCGEGCDCAPNVVTLEPPVQKSPRNDPRVAEQFFQRALAKDLSSADVFRITTTSFMDAYNFDIRQLMKSCVHHVLPSGHIIPFCAYNNLYRNGHVALPPLSKADSLEVMTSLE
jgi:7,8-dihydro-6-hydroxymethylpterin dimethyltransferase